MLFFLSFLSGVALFYTFQYFPYSSGFIFLLSSLWRTIKKRFIFIFLILLGIAFAFLRYEPLKDMSYIGGREFVVKGIFESHPVKSDSDMFKQAFTIKSALDMKAGEMMDDLAGREIMLFSDKEFDSRTEYEIAIKFMRDRTRLNPGRWNKEELYANLLDVIDSGERKLSLNSRIQEYRYRLDRYIGENFKTDSGSLIAAMTIGQRAYVNEDLRNAFNSTGLAHILSISGTHFGLFSVFLFGIFRSLIQAFPYRILQRITIFLTPSQAAALLCLPFMIAYLCLSGGSVPAVRSFIMIGLFLFGLIIGRKGFWLNSLIFAAFILTVWKPDVIFNLSFQLSFLAVLFIGFSIGYMEDERKEEKKEKRKIIRYLKNVLLLTLSASVGTAPLVAYHFHYFSLISPISNLFIAPLIGFILIPLSVVSSFIFLITGYYLFAPVVSAVSDVSIFLVRLLSDIPFADIKIPAFPVIIVFLFYAGFIFYFLSGKKRYTLLIPFVPILIYFSLAIFEKKDLTITFLDVGQGDSSVVELPDGKTIVIDTGRSGRETASFLKYKGRETIDAVILSHVHIDHIGGLDYILKRFEIKELWDNGRFIFPENFLANIRHRTLNRGDIVEGKGYSIYVFHPYPEFYTMYGNENVEADNDSLVLKIEGKNESFLFTGDIEEEAEEDILHLGKWLKSSVIKVPHHGSKTSAHMPFFEAVSPQFAIISAGRENPFGHPHKETLEVLNGVRIFRTDLDGAVKIEESAKGLRIKTYRDFQFEKAKSFREEMRNIKRLFETW
ncbi:MAG: DNA internalization-related competence protein ComEC/Rec2 [Nitrospira sp.]|nr:DNA internalization-related competence protein ComEC/Rec2 [Nitrospira sp.]